MNEIVINNNGGELTVSSVQVAEDFGKQHKDVLKSIDNLLKETSAKNFANLFIESTYADKYGRQQKSYEMTRDGFSLLVMGFTGSKALEWKLKYIQAFNAMEQELRQHKPIQTAEDKTKALEVKMMNARVRMSNQLLKLAKVDTLSEQYKSILVAKSAEVLTGEQLLPLPKSAQKTYSATDIAKMFNVSSQKIGRLAKEHNLKTSEYGEWYRDKSQYSSKEVDTFRYNDKAIERFHEIMSK